VEHRQREEAGASLTEELRSLLAAATDSWNLASPDNRLVGMRQEPGRVVRIRERASRSIVAKLTHEGWVRCAAFGPIGLLATGTDLSAHVWDARSGQEIAALDHPKQVRSVAFNATGKLLATACDDKFGTDLGSQEWARGPRRETTISSVPWRSIRMAPIWRLVATTTQPVCGTQPPTTRWRGCSTKAPFAPFSSAPTGRPWPRVRSRERWTLVMPPGHAGRPGLSAADAQPDARRVGSPSPR
jgi:WD domain, G-beta repeat